MKQEAMGSVRSVVSATNGLPRGRASRSRTLLCAWELETADEQFSDFGDDVALRKNTGKKAGKRALRTSSG